MCVGFCFNQSKSISVKIITKKGRKILTGEVTVAAEQIVCNCTKVSG